MLEIGTGLGWQTALLATLAKRVWSVERFPDLAEAARRNLAGRHRERGSRGRRRRPGARRARPLRRDRGLRGLAGGAVAADGAACGPRSPGPSARHRWRRAGDPVREAIGRGARGALSPEPASVKSSGSWTRHSTTARWRSRTSSRDARGRLARTPRGQLQPPRGAGPAAARARRGRLRARRHRDQARL